MYIKRVAKKSPKGKPFTLLYIYEYRIVDGKRKQVLIERLGRLGLEVSEKSAKIRLGQLLSSKGKTIVGNKLFKDAQNEFSEYYCDQIGQTIKQRTYDSFVYLSSKLSVFHSLKVTEIDFTSIERWKTDLKNSGLSNRTINLSIIELKKVLKFCLKKNYLEALPELESLREPIRGIHAHTQEEVELMLSESKGNSNLHNYLKLMLYTGMRPQEALLLTPDCIDFKKNTMDIRSDNKLKRGRVIPVDPRLLSDIASWIEETGRICAYTRADSVHSVLSKFSQKLGIVSFPRKLRATYASLMVQSDANPFRLSEIMGNSIQVLEKYYVAHNAKKLAKEMDKNPLLASYPDRI